MSKSPFKSRARGTAPTDFTVGVEILGPDGAPVTYKQEGERFAHAPATVKLTAGDVYAFRLHVSPDGANLG